MIANKSVHFHKLRQKKRPEVIFISVQPIRDLINQLNVEISNLQRKLNKHSLPSFNSREKKNREIEAHKDIINSLISDIDSQIKAINLEEKRIVISIRSYFLNILKRQIMLYRTIQQESLKKNEVYDECKIEENNEYEKETLLQMTMNRTAQIRQNIFNLTNTLLELKMSLKNQSVLIDRIDFYFDKSNFYLEEANREIEKIPGNYTEYKDLIIYSLIYVICILLVLTLIKLSRGMH